MTNPFVWIEGTPKINGDLAFEWSSVHGIPSEIFEEWVNRAYPPGSLARFIAVTKAYDIAHFTTHSEKITPEFIQTFISLAKESSSDATADSIFIADLDSATAESISHEPGNLTPSPMTLEQKKEECGRYYAATSLKEISEDVTIYGTTPSAGVRHLPLGYFPTEEDAVDALHSYLTNNNLI